MLKSDKQNLGYAKLITLKILPICSNILVPEIKCAGALSWCSSHSSRTHKFRRTRHTQSLKHLEPQRIRQLSLLSFKNKFMAKHHLKTTLVTYFSCFSFWNLQTIIRMYNYKNHIFYDNFCTRNGLRFVPMETRGR